MHVLLLDWDNCEHSEINVSWLENQNLPQCDKEKWGGSSESEYPNHLCPLAGVEQILSIFLHRGHSRSVRCQFFAWYGRLELWQASWDVLEDAGAPWKSAKLCHSQKVGLYIWNQLCLIWCDMSYICHWQSLANSWEFWMFWGVLIKLRLREILKLSKNQNPENNAGLRVKYRFQGTFYCPKSSKKCVFIAAKCVKSQNHPPFYTIKCRFQGTFYSRKVVKSVFEPPFYRNLLRVKSG